MKPRTFRRKQSGSLAWSLVEGTWHSFFNSTAWRSLCHGCTLPDDPWPSVEVRPGFHGPWCVACWKEWDRRLTVGRQGWYPPEPYRAPGSAWAKNDRPDSDSGHS